MRFDRSAEVGELLVVSTYHAAFAADSHDMRWIKRIDRCVGIVGNGLAVQHGTMTFAGIDDERKVIQLRKLSDSIHSHSSTHVKNELNANRIGAKKTFVIHVQIVTNIDKARFETAATHKAVRRCDKRQRWSDDTHMTSP